MNLIFIGPPGSGKGTAASKVAHEFSIPHISTGDIIRKNISNKTPLGIKAKKIVDSGGLIPDKLTIDLMQQRLLEADAQNGWIIDGFPRTIEQTTWTLHNVDVDLFVLFEVSEETIIHRLSGRLIHPGSGRVYHVEYNPPSSPMKDDITQEPLIQRPDDKPDVIRQRFENYYTETAPLLTILESQTKLADKLFTLDSSPAPEIVVRTICERVKKI